MRPSSTAPFAVLILVTALAAAAPARAERPPTLYMVAASHLDTQWDWTIQTTISEYIPATFLETFDRLERFPGVVVGWEGTFRYELLREYRPDLWDRLLGYVAEGRWRPAGSAVDAGDVNVPSPESLVRHFLLGNGWFRRELGLESVDVFLPDCFGFGWALPTIAAHCGLSGFSTQKLTWGGSVDTPFDVGVWRGPDGSELVAALNPHSYTTGLSGDLSADPGWIDTVARQVERSGVPVA